MLFRFRSSSSWLSGGMSLRAEDGPVSPAGSPQPAVHSRAGASAQGTLSQAEGRVRGGWPRAPPAFWGCTCPGPRPGAWAVTSTHSGGWQQSGTFRPRGASSRALGDGRGPGPLPSPFPIPARLRPARPQTLHASGFRPPAPPCGGCRDSTQAQPAWLCSDLPPACHARPARPDARPSATAATRQLAAVSTEARVAS